MPVDQLLRPVLVLFAVAIAFIGLRDALRAGGDLPVLGGLATLALAAVGYLGWKRQHGAGHRAGDHEKLHARKRALPPPPAAVDDGPDDGEA